MFPIKIGFYIIYCSKVEYLSFDFMHLQKFIQDAYEKKVNNLKDYKYSDISQNNETSVYSIQMGHTSNT